MTLFKQLYRFLQNLLEGTVTTPRIGCCVLHGLSACKQRDGRHHPSSSVDGIAGVFHDSLKLHTR
jgi:hypothetical protein